jgi:GNAT superfamily N-acetyltransferase
MDIVINHLEKFDFQHYLELMNQFRPVETDMTFEKFCEIYDKIFTYGEIYVARDDNKIIGSITVIYEQKFINHGAIYAHIEDVVVDTDYQNTGSKKGLKIGCRLIDYAKKKSIENKTKYFDDMKKEALKNVMRYGNNLDKYSNYINDYDIVLLEDVKCENKDQLFQRERYYQKHSAVP